MITPEQLKKLQNSGLKPNQIAQVVKAAGGIGVEREGVGKWLFGNRTSLPGMALEAGANILNVPSYAIGGILNQGQRAFGSKYGQKTDATGLGVIEGIRNKRAVFTEAPETFGVDPNSGMGKVIGFAGELLTPNIPLVGAVSKIGKTAKVGNVFRKGKAVSRIAKPNVFSKLSSKAAGIKDDAAQALLTKSYKLSATDIDKIAKSLNITDEAQKVPQVIAYLENLGLVGSNRASLQKLNSIASDAQGTLNSMVRTNTNVGRKMYAEALLKQADELARSADTPSTRQLVNQLRDEAKRQLALSEHGVEMTDTFLRDTATKAFNEASEESINNPYAASLSEQIGRAGVSALDTYKPGSAAMGTKLRGIRTTQDVIGKKSRTGLGTQLVNAFKPSAYGAGIGAAASYSQGENPLIGGAIGALGGVALNNPRVLNTAGKTLTQGVKVSAPAGRGFNAGMRVASRVPLTTARLAGSSTRLNPTNQPAGNQSPSTYQSASTGRPLGQSEQDKRSITYQPPSTLNPSRNAAFGRVPRVQRGSFY